MYDYLIVGAGLFGSTFAYIAQQKGKTVLVIDKRPQTGGNLYCEKIEDINVHKYGAHIFHTSNNKVWSFVNSFVEFNRFINSPVANYKGRLFNLPFNMNTFNQLWGTITPEDAKAKIIEQQKMYGVHKPANLEEQAISLVGKDIYEILIKEYTEKQWGRKAKDLPPFIIKRLPVRFIYDNNYFNDTYQGIPIGGYNQLIDRMLDGVECKINTNYFDNREYFDSIAETVVFTGKIDEYFNYCFGKLEYRSLRFEEEILPTDNYQGNAVVNYTSKDVPFTRIIEHKHFEFGSQPKTIITKEFSEEWNDSNEPYYPVNDSKNNILYKQYQFLANERQNVIFGGRLAEYAYYDMHQIVEKVINIFDY
ncbi:MAG: UDP-galactopyranose mutase [Parabacteroides sp.]|nr:UDP-galactopyranose mutase [Parabacteroides sp.]